MDIFYGDLVDCEDKELTNFNVALKIKQPRDMLSKDNPCHTLTINKIFNTTVNLRATPKFEMLEDSIDKYLI